jgi:hypothetical protein
MRGIGVLKWLFISLGTLSVFGGIVTFWLPLPIGVPLMLLGTTLLVRHSPQSRRQVVRLVRRYPQTLGFVRNLLGKRRDAE